MATYRLINIIDVNVEDEQLLIEMAREQLVDLHGLDDHQAARETRSVEAALATLQHPTVSTETGLRSAGIVQTVGPADTTVDATSPEQLTRQLSRLPLDQLHHTVVHYDNSGAADTLSDHLASQPDAG